MAQFDWAEKLAPYAKFDWAEKLASYPKATQQPLIGGGFANDLDMALQSGWQGGVDRAQELDRPTPVLQGRDWSHDLMMAMGRAGGDLRKNAPLLWGTGPGRMAQGLARFASGGTPVAGPGLRREDYTDDPSAREPIEPMIHDSMNVADVMSLGGMPMAAVRGAERSALGIGVPPKMSPQEQALAALEAAINRTPSKPPVAEAQAVVQHIRPTEKALPLPLIEQDRAALVKGIGNWGSLVDYAKSRGMSDGTVKALIDDNFASIRTRADAFEKYIAAKER